jgi:hypothetical protein
MDTRVAAEVEQTRPTTAALRLHRPGGAADAPSGCVHRGIEGGGRSDSVPASDPEVASSLLPRFDGVPSRESCCQFRDSVSSSGNPYRCIALSAGAPTWTSVSIRQIRKSNADWWAKDPESMALRAVAKCVTRAWINTLSAPSPVPLPGSLARVRRLPQGLQQPVPIGQADGGPEQFGVPRGRPRRRTGCRDRLDLRGRHQRWRGAAWGEQEGGPAVLRASGPSPATAARRSAR